MDISKVTREGVRKTLYYTKSLCREEINVTWLCYNKKTERINYFFCTLMTINESSYLITGSMPGIRSNHQNIKIQ